MIRRRKNKTQEELFLFYKVGPDADQMPEQHNAKYLIHGQPGS